LACLDPGTLQGYLLTSMSSMHSIQLRIRIDETLIPAARRAGEGCSPALIPHPPSGTKVRNQDFRNSRRRDFDADAYQPQSRAFGTRPRFSQPRFEAPSGPALHAAVKWFSPEKGFGFVELSDGSGDAFLHGSVLAQTGIGAVQPGETLEVRVGPGHKGPHVTEVLPSIRALLFQWRHGSQILRRRYRPDHRSRRPAR
jgi:cold shock CspA family protein